MIGRLVRSVCVWYVYFPHLTVMRWLGPRIALALTRVFAWGHWLLTFATAHQRARRVIARVLPELGSRACLGTIMRRYLEVKHQRFMEWYLYPTPRGRRFVRRTYADFEGREHLDAAQAEGKGVVVLVFHFGMAKIVFPALEALGYDNYHHVFRGSTYADDTVGSVARAARDALARSEEASGLKVIYHRPGYTFVTMVRLLRRGSIVGMNGDGMMGTEFAEVPFLGGTMSFPTGPARLAACAGAPIVSVYAMHQGLTRHQLVAHPPIHCGADTKEAVEGTVAEYVKLLEEYVRKYPWAWWTWRRLDVDELGEGRARFTARALVAEEDAYHAPVMSTPPG